MGSLYDFYTGLGRTGANFGIAGMLHRYAYDHSHGGARYLLSQVPVLGQSVQMFDRAKYYEDVYKNSGVDPLYSQNYGSSGTATLGAIAASGAKLGRMAKSLSGVYGADVIENCSAKIALERARQQTAFMYGQNADRWKSAWATKNRYR